MCAAYTPSPPEKLEKWFHVAAPDSDFKAEVYPGYMAPIIRPPRADAMHGDRACALAMFGLVPHWGDIKLARSTYNARTETVATKPSFRSAYKNGQFCVIPVNAFYEPSYESGKAVRWEIASADGEPIGLAGIWEYKKDGPNGLPLLSFTMLTINADGHPLMQRFHKPEDEKRMVVILRPDQYDDWLHCPTEDAADFFTPYPAQALTAHAAPKRSRTAEQDTLPL